MELYLCFFVSVFALFLVFVVDSPLGQIDVAFVFVHPQHGDNLVFAHSDHLVDGSDTPTGQLAEKWALLIA